MKYKFLYEWYTVDKKRAPEKSYDLPGACFFMVGYNQQVNLLLLKYPDQIFEKGDPSVWGDRGAIHQVHVPVAAHHVPKQDIRSAVTVKIGDSRYI